MTGSWKRATQSLCLLPIVLVTCVSVATAQTPLDPEAYDLNMSKGLMELSNGQYETAERLFRAALEAHPNDPEAGFYLAQSLTRMKRYEEAEFLIRRMLGPDPENGRLQLALGIVLYNREQYEKALEALASAERQLPEDPLVPYYQGLSYHQLGDYDRSPARFLRARLLSPDLAQSSHYFSGLAYYQRGVLEEATEEFEATIASGDPESELARSARDYLEQVEAASTGPRRWDLTFSVAGQYDTNVVLLPLGTQPPGGASGITRQRDYVVSFYGRGEYRPLQTPEWQGGASYAFFQSVHRTLSDFDVTYHSPTAYIQRQFGPLQTRFLYAFDYAEVGGEPYLVANAVESTSMVSEEGRAFMQFRFRVQGKKFQDDKFPTNSFRDATNWLASVTQYFMFANGAGYAWLGFTFDKDVTPGGSVDRAIPGVQTSADWAYNGYRFSSGLNFPPIYKVKLNATFDYYRQQYLNPSSFSVTGTVPRHDNIYFVTATLGHDLNKIFSFALQYSYTRDQANLKPFDYNRSIYSVFLTATF